ncbi:proteolipid protein 2-like [Bombyx mandarina]|uniref:Proteolipid protein 2-like n=1 Tax=Bombyx mandarina TaxID=7092 RepID=A0A6J2KAE9_BOMMA|nr:proteolipid protein 2-like [Bombyx mandarina]
MFDNFHNNQTVAQEPPPPKKVLRCDKSYVTTIPGILKVVQVCCNIIGFICIKVSWSWVSAIFYNIVYWIGNILTILLLLAYTCHFVEKYDHWPWFKYEFFYCSIMALAYVVCSIFAATIGESVGYAVVFFGLVATCAYGFDAYQKYKGWNRGLPPQ